MSATGVAPGMSGAPVARALRRGWIAAGVAVILAFALLGLVAEAFAPGPAGPAESSLATSSSGLAAWAELLSRAGHPVSQLRHPLSAARVSPGSTLVAVGASALSPAAGERIRAFAQAGGRLVLGGGSLNRVMATLIQAPPSWSPTGPRTYDNPGLTGVGTVLSAGEGSFEPGRRLLVGRPVGRGEIELLADASPVENRLLGQADNAQLAIGLAGAAGRPVVFAEALHGYGEATGLAAIPASWWLTFSGLALAGGAWAVSRGRRLGPSETPAPPAVPPRSAYVDALAATLLRARDPQRVARLASEAEARARRRQ